MDEDQFVWIMCCLTTIAGNTSPYEFVRGMWFLAAIVFVVLAIIYTFVNLSEND